MAVNRALPPEALALLDTIAGTESPGYNVIYGGRRFGDYSDHPRVSVPIGRGVNAGKTSSAAGRYQFLGSTWDSLGLPNFSPPMQDFGAWKLAQRDYKAKTGNDLLSDLRRGDIGQIGKVLSSTWTSLPSGIEAGTNVNKFGNAYQRNLGQYADSGQIMTDVPPQDDYNPFAAHITKRQESRKQAAQPADDYNPFAVALERRKAAPAAEQGGYNINPIAKRNAAESIVTAPKVDAAAAFGSGILRGLGDVGAGINRTNDLLAGYNPLTALADKLTGGLASAPRKAVSASIDSWNRDSNKAFADKYGDSTAADIGRFTGNMLPMMIPGTQGAPVTGIVPKIAQGAGVGAIQNMIIGGGRNPDADLGTEALQGAAFGAGGSAVGSAIGKGVARMTGAMQGAGQPASNSAIKKLLDASAPNLDDVTAAARLQDAIKRGNTTMVEGAAPTLPQAAMLPGISQVRRDVVNYSPANALVDREALQEVARLSALGSISDVSGLTAQDAAQAAGMQIGGQVRGAHQAAKAATSDLYQSPALQQAIVPMAGNRAATIYNDAFVVGGRSIGGDPTLKAAADVLEQAADMPFAEVNRLRSLVGSVASDYNKDAVTRRAATQMVKDIDDRLETLPEFAPAKAARAEQGRLYESGIVGDITGKKGSGEYRLTEDAITRKLLSTSPGQTARMQQFKAVADPQSMGAAQRAFMADLLERSGRNLDTDAAKLLPSQLAGYTNKRSGMMQEMFSTDELATISGVTKDAQRAAAADALGKATGSNTAQNLHGALNLGLLDNPLLNSLSRNTVGRVPLAGDVASAAASGIKNSQRQKLANELADLLSNPEMTDKALTAYIRALRGGQVGSRAGGLLSVPASQGLLDK